jgi:hypothetical protein
MRALIEEDGALAIAIDYHILISISYRLHQSPFWVCVKQSIINRQR